MNERIRPISDTPRPPATIVCSKSNIESIPAALSPCPTFSRAPNIPFPRTLTPSHSPSIRLRKLEPLSALPMASTAPTVALPAPVMASPTNEKVPAKKPATLLRPLNKNLIASATPPKTILKNPLFSMASTSCEIHLPSAPVIPNIPPPSSAAPPVNFPIAENTSTIICLARSTIENKPLKVSLRFLDAVSLSLNLEVSSFKPLVNFLSVSTVRGGNTSLKASLIGFITLFMPFIMLNKESTRSARPPASFQP